VHGSDLDEILAYRRFNGTSWEDYHILHGGQDTAAKLVNQSGQVVEQYEYDPFGKATVYTAAGALVDVGPAGTSPEDGTRSAYGLMHLYKAMRLDPETGNCYVRNRFYDPRTGRFMSRDPIGVWGDGGNMGNEYAYAWNRPLVVGDPLGLFTIVVVILLPETGENETDNKAVNKFNRELAKIHAQKDPDGGRLVEVSPDGKGGYGVTNDEAVKPHKFSSIGDWAKAMNKSDAEKKRAQWCGRWYENMGKTSLHTYFGHGQIVFDDDESKTEIAVDKVSLGDNGSLPKLLDDLAGSGKSESGEKLPRATNVYIEVTCFVGRGGDPARNHAQYLADALARIKEPLKVLAPKEHIRPTNHWPADMKTDKESRQSEVVPKPRGDK
jgi:RHS repeat-associated protein